MHRPIFGHSFAVLVAPVLLSVLAFNFLNKKKTSARRNAEDVDTGTSASMTASTRNYYEVFLSFRGSDTRNGFTDHLYHRLVDAGIDAFRDDDKLRKGENIRPELLAAIRNSKISIPILSVNYGTSSWCLDELVQIMECKNNNGHIVLPIFYKVKPAEVRHQIGSFGDEFRKRERRFNPMTLEKWKQALIEVSTLKGYEADGPEAELVESVVQEALNELKKKFELVISENLVGIDSHVRKVIEFMDNNSYATLFVGIHGMGGIGKTTLAKAIYNELSNQFDYRSFIANIRESWKHNSVHYLHNQLIDDILKLQNQVHNEDEGIKFISTKFKGKKVLVLLDDVDNVVQLKSLAGNRDWFSSGSRIIITTRNKRILEEVRVDYAYDHKEMDNDQSLVLFSKHAFRMDSPPREFKDLTQEVVLITGGLPLSIEVFGSLLCGKKSTIWRHTINKLKNIPDMKVQERLRISYDALEDQQKQIFLDIACFFIGTDKRIASYMWEACHFFPGQGIEALRFMSLIKIVNDHELRMHDQLRDLGREIVRKESQWPPQYRSRLWDSKEALKVLKDNKGSDKIEAINLSEGNSEGLNEIFPLQKDEGDGDIYTEKQFKNLANLRYLHMINAHLSGDFKDLMKGLKWLQWRKCPVSFEVNNFDVKELVVLELQGSKINEKWEGWSLFKMVEKLKYLDLSYCKSLENTDFLSAFKELEVLILHGNESLSALPNSIGSLENLKILNICNSGIEELPKGVGMLRNLQELNALSCRNLKRIMVKTMCNLSSLQRLDFGFCESLQLLPDLPSGLTHLGVTCQSCKLASLSHLANLKELRVLDSRYFVYRRVYSQMLQSMQLKSSECSQSADVEESESPQSLNTPSKLEFLKVLDGMSIETLDISQSIHLRTLDARGCDNLLEVRGLDKSIYLESLTVISCNSIERLDLPKFKGLKKLNVANCKKLAEIQGLGRLEHLERLDIQGCTSMERLFLPKSGRLKKLHARGCKNLVEIQGLDRSEYLERLNIKGCTSMEMLDLPKFGMVKELDVGKCKNLVAIQDLDRSKYLESLDIGGWTSIESLDLSKSGRLKKLNARGCKNLAEIQGLDRLEYLERLDISGCISMERLSLPKFKSLEILKTRDCANLVEIQGLDRLESLGMLDISRCTSIERLLLPKSNSLKILKARNCENLVEIQGLDKLDFLEELNVIGCTSLKIIPELSGTWIYLERGR